jgi:hypothetical protein
MREDRLLKTALKDYKYKTTDSFNLQKFQTQLTNNFGVQSFQTSKMFDLTLS